MSRIDWPPVIARARAIVHEYDTAVTLRQVFYRLVAERLLANKQAAYTRLSSLTAEARRAGRFPDLIDNTRTIHRLRTFHSPTEATAWLGRLYQRDHSEFMDTSIYLAVEKRTMVAQLQSWFGAHGLPVIACAGYASQSYVHQIVRDVKRRGRPGTLLYAGDFDPSGEDIGRDFLERTDCWAYVERVALTAEQVREYDLPMAVGKDTDTRAAGFEERHGGLFQVELEALAPHDLRALYEAALEPYWDTRLHSSAVSGVSSGTD